MFRNTLLSGIILLFALFSCQSDDSLEGDRYFSEGNYEKALSCYNDYLKMKPNNLKTIYNRGRCYEELQQYDKSLEAYKKVAKKDPKNEKALLSIAQHYYRESKYKDALFYCDKVIEFNQKEPLSHLLKGKSLHRQGETFDALNEYNYALRLNPEYGEAYYYRGALKLLMGKKKGACEDLKKAVAYNIAEAEAALKKNCR